MIKYFLQFYAQMLFEFSQDPGFTENAFYSTEKEISEIEALIPEIREKIDDTNDMQIEEAKRSNEEAEQENTIIQVADKEKRIQNGSAKGEPKITNFLGTLYLNDLSYRASFQ